MWPGRCPVRAALMGAEVPLADHARPGAGPAAGGCLTAGSMRWALRAVMLAYAVEAGMPENRAKDVMLAAHELAANAVRHGAGAEQAADAGRGRDVARAGP